MDKVKAYIYALVAGFLNPFPSRIAVAVAVLAVLANLLGACAAVRKGEPVSGSKILKGMSRIVLYFLAFNALYHALKDFGIAMHALSAIYSAIALHEFLLLMQKANECGILPAGILKILRKHVSTATDPRPEEGGTK